VIVDEAHRMSKFVTDWMGNDDWAGVPFIGLSATPWAKGLGRLYDKLIIAATTQQLIADKHLSPFRVFAPSHPDLTGVRTRAGDYHEGDLSRRWARAR
jgi:DNA repair protein RadD